MGLYKNLLIFKGMETLNLKGGTKMKKTTIALFMLISLVTVLFCGCGIEAKLYEDDGGNTVVTQATIDSKNEIAIETETVEMIQSTINKRIETSIETSGTVTVSSEMNPETVTTELADKSTYIAQVETTVIQVQTTPVPVQVSAQAPAVDAGTPYHVKYGDTLYALASRCKNEQGEAISVDYLLQFNHWTDDSMYEGDILFIPSGYTLQENTEYTPEPEVEQSALQYIEVYGEHSNTSYTAGWNSFENMIAACNVLNGMTIPANSTFSWLNDVEPYSSPNYVTADCYYGDTVIQDYGGGICMVSSTLKVAAYNAGLSIIASSPHSMPVSYVNRQTEDWQFLEAAVDSGSGMDLVIYNPLDRDVTISAWVSYPTVTVVIQ